MNFFLPLKLGQTALHEASEKGNVSMVEFLLANFNANLDAKDIVSEFAVTSIFGDKW